MARIAQQAVKTRLGGFKLHAFAVPHGGTSGSFSPPNFRGYILTPDGIKADDVDFVIWCGVLTRPAYDVIRPAVEGIPELSVGVGWWSDEVPQPVFDQHLRIFKERLHAKSANPNWNSELVPQPADPSVLIGTTWRSLSFIDLHSRAGGDFWDAIALGFFQDAFSAIASLNSETLNPKPGKLCGGQLA